MCIMMRLFAECNCIDAHLVYDIDVVRQGSYANYTGRTAICRTLPLSRSDGDGDGDGDGDADELFECTNEVYRKFDAEIYKCNACRVPCRSGGAGSAGNCSELKKKLGIPVVGI